MIASRDLSGSSELVYTRLVELVEGDEAEIWFVDYDFQFGKRREGNYPKSPCLLVTRDHPLWFDHCKSQAMKGGPDFDGEKLSGPAWLRVDTFGRALYDGRVPCLAGMGSETLRLNEVAPLLCTGELGLAIVGGEDHYRDGVGEPVDFRSGRYVRSNVRRSEFINADDPDDPTPYTARVYDLELEEWNCYFVGELPVLVGDITREAVG
jgi:hypothetical protein